MTSPSLPTEVTRLDDAFSGDSILFYAKTFASDGITLATPASAVISIFNFDDGSTEVAAAACSVGLGYAQYQFVTTTATPGPYFAVMSITFSGGEISSESFYVKLLPKPVAFTTDLSTVIGEIRMHVGDDVLGAGVLPDGSNVADEILQKQYDLEGDTMRAVAAVCEMLARRWTIIASRTVGPRSEQLGSVAGEWRKRAQELRDVYGNGSATSTLEGGVIQLTFAEENVAGIDD